MNLRPLTFSFPIRKIAVLIVVLAGAVQAAPPPSRPSSPTFRRGHDYQKPRPQATPMPFTTRDFIRFTAAAPKGPFHVGDPVTFDLRLVNHTEYAAAIIAAFHPRASLKVTIQPPGQRQRRTYGPYKVGDYPEQDNFLYPLEERPAYITLWGDIDTPSGLVFPEPGRYEIKLELEVGAQLSKVRGTIPALAGDLKPLPPFKIDILPTPADYAPLVQRLAGLRAFPELQLKTIPEGLAGEIEQMIAQYPATPITPYLDYAVASRAWKEAGEKFDNDKAYNLAVRHLQRVALSDAPTNNDACLALVRLFDKRGLAYLARESARRLLATAPRDLAVLYGLDPDVERYLIDSAEMNPIAYWSMLE